MTVIRQCPAEHWYSGNHGVTCEFPADGHELHSFEVPETPDVPEPIESIELKTLTIEARVRVGDQRVGLSRTVLVPPPGTPIDTYAALHAPALLADLVPVLTRELTRALQKAQSGQFQGD